MKFFVYGTLMDPVFTEQNLGLRQVSSVDHELIGFDLYMASGGHFPLMLRSQSLDRTVKGKLVEFELVRGHAIQDEDDVVIIRDMLEILDGYEGANGPMPLYFRRESNGINFYVSNPQHPYVTPQLKTKFLIEGGDWNVVKQRVNS